MFTVTVLPTCTWIFELVCVLNPGANTVTAACGIAALEGSVTVPTIWPVAAGWPDAVLTHKRDGKKARRSTLKEILMFRFFKIHLQCNQPLYSWRACPFLAKT